ncbi:hypothetical protein BKA93DRAFT_697626, partial [Sparassis latifolia]
SAGAYIFNGTHRAINDMPIILKQVFSELAADSGWDITVIAGGPCPDEGGNIVTIA